jgi:sugar lactone lactonase YvrE
MLSNSYKVQNVSSYLFEGQYNIKANSGLIGTDIYSTSLYYNPEDIALDREGFIFVVDAGRDTADLDTTKAAPGFYRFSSAGAILQSVIGLGAGEKSFYNPKGIAVSPFKDEQVVYIADTGNNRIMLFKLSTD